LKNSAGSAESFLQVWSEIGQILIRNPSTSPTYPEFIEMASGVNQMTVALKFPELDYSLPSVQLSGITAVTENKAHVVKRGERLERKVVTNAGLLITPRDRRETCSKKLAGCLSDAVGLQVSFRALGL
jgi:hypothetical protein